MSAMNVFEACGLADTQDFPFLDSPPCSKSMSANTCRRRINEFLATKEMTQTEFLRQIGGVDYSSLRNFMNLKGESGYRNGAYWGAKAFFQARDAAAKAAKKAAKAANKTPSKATTAGELSSPATEKKRPADSSSSLGGPADLGGAAKKSKSSKAAFEEFVAKVQAVQLPTNAIFDNCDEVRNKAFAFIAAEGITKAAFLRACGDMTYEAWGRFTCVKGPTCGRHHGAYFKIYSFLEKVRIFRGEPKTQKRLKAEQDGPGGYSTESEHHWVIAFTNNGGIGVVREMAP